MALSFLFFFKVNSVLVEGTRLGFEHGAGACGICWGVGWSQAAAPTSGSPPRPGEMNGNFQAAPCSQPNPRGDLSLAAVGQERVGWAASHSSFPCQKVSKASHTFSSSLRQKNTVPPHSGARWLLPAAPKPGGKPLPLLRALGTPSPAGKGTCGHLWGERPPMGSPGEGERVGGAGLAPEGHRDGLTSLLLPYG